MLASSAVLAFELGTDSDSVAVSGDLTLDGRLDITDAGGFGPGVYTLFTYNGVLTDNGLDVGTKPDMNLVYMISTNTPGQVKLNVLTQFAAWQIQYFGSTNNPDAAPGADPLGKGMSNTNQYLAGLNPTNPSSVFEVSEAARDNSSHFEVKWFSVGGKGYRLQFGDGDTNGSYNGVFTDIPVDFTDPNPEGTQGTLGFVDDFTITGAVTNRSRYYRVRLN